MGFFSDIISDAQRVSATAFQTGIEPGTEKADGSLFDDPGLDMTEAAPQRRVDGIRAVPRTDASQGMANPGDILLPPDTPGAGPSEKLAVVPDHGMAAKPVFVAPLATGGEPIGPRIEPRHQETHFESEPAGLDHPATAEASITTQPASGSRATAGPEPVMRAGGGRAEQERRQAAMPRQAEAVVAQRVEAERAGSGVEAAAGAAMNVAISAPVAAENPSAEQREAARVDSVSSRLVASAPAAIDLTPARRTGQSQGAATNAGPQVHIGHIDIVVLAPEPARPLQPPLSASADLASRHYLRRL